MVLLLQFTKQNSPNSTKIFLDNPVVVELIIRFCSAFGGQAGERVFPLSYTTFARWFKVGLDRIGIPAGNYRSHSFRRGGATALSLKGLSLHRIMEFGRWASESSCKLYLRKGEVLLLRFQKAVPKRVLDKIQEWSSMLANVSFRNS